MNAPARRKRRSSRTALVLGGGGFTGGVYEIGALRALDLLVRQPHGQPLRHLRRHQRRLARRRAGGQRRHARADDAGASTTRCRRALPPIWTARCCCAQLPRVRAEGAEAAAARWSASPRNVGAHRSARSRPSTSARRSPTRCPSGIYTGAGVEDYVREALSEDGRTDDFRLLEQRALPGRHRPRHLRADRPRRRGLGRRADLEPRSRASTALPMVYAPVRVRGPRARRRRHRLDHQPRHRRRGGREVHRRRQPLVPYVNDFAKTIPTLFGTRVRRVSDMGFPKIGNQTFKLLAYQRLHEMAGQLGGALPGRRHRPGRARARRRADVPDEHPQLLASRVDVARHGFESVTLKLAKDYDQLREVAAATASRSPRRGCARSCAHFEVRRAREDPRLAARSSSRPPAPCCASPT